MGERPSGLKLVGSGEPRGTRPLAILDLHNICNQRCAYCVAGSGPGREFGPVADPAALGQIHNFFSHHGPFDLLLTGGEPLITPGLGDLLGGFLERGHTVSLQTNLKAPVEEFTRVVRPESTQWILASLHSLALDRLESFVAKAHRLRQEGYPVVVKLVMDQTMTDRLEMVYDRFALAKVPVLLAPLIHFEPNREPYPHEYSVEEWRRIAPRITLRSTWLYFAGGWRSQGAPCRAGSGAFYMRLDGGEVCGCAHSFPRGLGNIYEDRFEPLAGPCRCGLDLCICDFNYYVGMIPQLDDRANFAALVSGRQQTVGFAAYRSWLEAQGTRPVRDLEPMLTGEAVAAQASGGPAAPRRRGLMVAGGGASGPAWQAGAQAMTAGGPDGGHALMAKLGLAIEEASVGSVPRLGDQGPGANPTPPPAPPAAPPRADATPRPLAAAPAGKVTPTAPGVDPGGRLKVVPVARLHRALGWPEPLDYPQESLVKPLDQWRMEDDDAPIFRYLYRNLAPRRHLEFGTWQGQGVLYCLEESPATVWTLNLPFGERGSEEGPGYGFDDHEVPLLEKWAERIGVKSGTILRTDGVGFIGRHYLMADLGHRVNQIYCDSTRWEGGSLPPGFFDSALIDGGHTAEVVASDTEKALPLVRSGGLIMWHDFCPKVWRQFEATQGVMEGIRGLWPRLAEELSDLFWIDPSWILLGVKR